MYHEKWYLVEFVFSFFLVWFSTNFYFVEIEWHTQPGCWIWLFCFIWNFVFFSCIKKAFSVNLTHTHTRTYKIAASIHDPKWETLWWRQSWKLAANLAIFERREKRIENVFEEQRNFDLIKWISAQMKNVSSVKWFIKLNRCMNQQIHSFIYLWWNKLFFTIGFLSSPLALFEATHTRIHTICNI